MGIIFKKSKDISIQEALLTISTHTLGYCLGSEICKFLLTQPIFVCKLHNSVQISSTHFQLMGRKQEILLTMQRTIKNGVHYLCLLDVSYIDKSILRHINYVAMQKTHIAENRRDLHFSLTSGIIHLIYAERKFVLPCLLTVYPDC